MTKKRLLFIPILSVFSFITVFAQDISINELFQNYQYTKVDQILKDVASFEDIPAIANFTSLLSEKNAETMPAQSQPNLKSVTDMFYEVQAQFFAHVPISLKYCTKENDCGFTAEYRLKEIHFQLDLVKKILDSKSYKNPLDVLRYITAHEIAHYVLEISTQPPYSNKEGVSLHGNASAYQDGYTKFINSLNDVEKQEFYQGKSDSIVYQNFEKFLRADTVKIYRAHAEVDMIATVKLKQSGFTNWRDIIQFFDDTIDEEKRLSPEMASILDFENRKRVILKTLKEYQ